MRTEFALAEYFMQFGTTQALQHRMTSRHAMAAHMGCQQLAGPQFVGISQFLRLPTGAVLNPNQRVVGQLTRPAWPRQLSQRGIEPEFQALPDAEHYRAAAHIMAPSDRFVACARQRIQQQRRT
jgi:hypothetical protein